MIAKINRMPRDSGKLFLKGIGILSVSIVILGFSITGTAMAQGDDWKFGIEGYGWAPRIDGETASGSDFTIDLNNILDNLNFTFMGVVAARKGKWSFTTDIMYMDLEADNSSTLPTNSGIVGLNTDVELKAWILTPAIGYSVIESDKVNLNVIGGARYLYLDMAIEHNTSTTSGNRYNRLSDSGNNWDGIIGVRGGYAFNEKWYMPFYGDIGTGDSDFTFQVAAGIGYKFDIVDVVLLWRYLDWNFADDSVLDDLSINGPMLGVKYIF